ncbi:unnamed protein product [Rhodiola kirilowii]
MNRAVVRSFGAGVQSMRFLHKGFCSSTGLHVSSSTACESSQGHEGKPSLSSDGNECDVAIVGGGMVGMALACSLATSPLTEKLKVVIVDSNPALQNKNLINKDDPPDARVSTVTPATISFFKDVGAWNYVEQHRHAYFDIMQVWDYTGLGYTRYKARDVNKDILGCVVENKVLLSALLSRIQTMKASTSIYPSKLSTMKLNSSSASKGDSTEGEACPHRQLAKLELSDGSSMYTKLVVGADGGKSRVRELAGLRTTGWSYSQNAIICTVEHSKKNHCAWQRFLPSGPIALLPIGDTFSNVVWTMTPKEASDFKSVTEDEFVYALNHALDYGYGPHPGSGNIFPWLRSDATSSVSEAFEVPPKVVKLSSERMVFPLSLMHAKDYVAKRVVLVGDAAHTVHPLAGQGVNLGFGDAFALSRIISEGIAVGSDVGEVPLLKRYETERKAANVAMMAILDGFQKAYSVDFGPLNILRAAAFHGAQYIKPLKKSIISYASGEQKFPFL